MALLWLSNGKATITDKTDIIHMDMHLALSTVTYSALKDIQLSRMCVPWDQTLGLRTANTN